MTTTIGADRVWDGHSVHENATVRVDGGRIVGIDSDGSPGDADVYVPGTTLMPGLIDTHIHIVWDYSPRPEQVLALELPERTVLRAARHATEQLQAGVTTVRDLGATGALSVPLAQAISAGEVVGPRLIPAGRAIAMTGGHGWSLCVEADGPDAVRRATRAEIKNGARAIKLIASGGVYGKFEKPENPQLGYAEVAAAVEEAHNAGCLVAAHAYAPPVINMCLDAGVDSIEHGSLLDEPTARRMAEQGVFLVPTLSVFDAIYRSSDGDTSSDIARKATEVRKAALESCGMAASLGVPIAVGSDAGAPGNPHGAVANEVALMVEAGLTNEQALSAATVNAARAIGLPDEVGQLSPGASADLVLVGGDPLASTKHLDDVRFVMARGDVVVRP